MTSGSERYRQVTCLTRAGIDKRAVNIPSDPRLDIAPGQTAKLCEIVGSGRIVRFWVTLPVFGRGAVLRSAVLRMFWDGEASPSVECPLGDFFGAAFGKPRSFVSDRLSIAGGGYVSYFDMPFNGGARIEVENQASSPLRLLFFQIGYYENREAPREALPTFHAQWRRENPTVAGDPFVALTARGKGSLVGVKLDIQNRSWWLRPPVRRVFFPRGLGLGMLEGPEKIVVDGDELGAVVGTGTEDFFQGGWYFKGGPFQTGTHGVTVRSFPLGRASAYRLFTFDPVPFRQSIKVSFDHGVENEMQADYTSVAYWYQTEPHASPPLLPKPEQRLPSSVGTNLLQFVVACGLLAGLLVFVAGALLVALKLVSGHNPF